jgi:hypothetical protein
LGGLAESEALDACWGAIRKGIGKEKKEKKGEKDFKTCKH